MDRRIWFGLLLLMMMAGCGQSSPSSPAPSPPTNSGGGTSVGGSGGSGGLSIETGGSVALSTCDDDLSSVGCDFYSARPPGKPPSESEDTALEGACLAAYVVNVSPSAVTLGVEHAGVALPIEALARIPRGQGRALSYEPLPRGVLPPGEVAVLFLEHRESSRMRCPIAAGIDTENEASPPSLSARGHAFHLTSSAPVAAYDIFPYGGGQSAVTSATLLLPTRTWGLNYVGVSAYKPNWPSLPSTLQVVAAEDDTEITLLPKASIDARQGVEGATAGVAQTYRLARGELLQLAATDTSELVGSPLSANKPFGLWGAAGCIEVGRGPACDSAHQQIPPVRALGSAYVAVRYKQRFPNLLEFPPWRIVGAADGTTLTYDPAPPKGAPTALSAGDMVEFDAAGPFEVRSQDAEHPFYLASYMTGCASDALNAFGTDCRGDPEFVNVIPAAQYQRAYTFFTDPTYPETSLVVVRKKTDGAFHDVKLDCAGTLGDWKPVGSAGEHEYTYVTLVSGNFEPQGNCDNGRHELESDGYVGLTVWGWGSALTGDAENGAYTQAVSYAYPAGAAVASINDVVVPTVK